MNCDCMDRQYEKLLERVCERYPEGTEVSFDLIRSGLDDVDIYLIDEIRILSPHDLTITSIIDWLVSMLNEVTPKEQYDQVLPRELVNLSTFSTGETGQVMATLDQMLDPEKVLL